MNRRKISLLLAILTAISTMALGFTPVAAGSDDGITTDTSAPYDEYDEIRKLKQKDQSNQENREPQVIQRESLYTKTVDNGDYRPLEINQYLVVLRTGIHIWPPDMEDPECVVSDYHFWYQTKDGTWANKHGSEFDSYPDHLSAGTTPFSETTSGWDKTEYMNFYDSQIFCYIITVN